MRDALPPGFADLQAWLAAALLSRGDLPEKLQRARDATGLSAAQVMKSGQGASLERRLDVYASGYVLRLVECLKAQFPILHADLGEDVFQAFAKAYIVEEPPAHWDLDALGEGFADFLARTRPPGVNDPDMQAMLALPPEIAAFERAVARAENFAAPTPNIPADFMLALLPADAALRLKTGAALLELGAFTLQTLAAHGHAHLATDTGAEALLISCVGYQARAARLEPWQFAFLSACNGSRTLAGAARRASKRTGVAEKDIRARLTLWLPLVMTALETEDAETLSPAG